MNQIQKQAFESLVRVRAFLDSHPVSGALSYTDARTTLDDALRRSREYVGAHIAGRSLSRGEVQRQRQLIQQLIDRHVRPIVAIARTQVDPDSNVRMPAAFRMPKLRVGVTRLLHACEGMIEAARPFEATFVARGLPADFLARFTAARNELEVVLGGRATLTGAHVEARTGLGVQLRRGRRAVDRLDSIVRATFDGDAATLAAWRTAKRLHLIAGPSAERSTVADEVKEAPQVPSQALQQAA